MGEADTIFDVLIALVNVLQTVLLAWLTSGPFRARQGHPESDRRRATRPASTSPGGDGKKAV